MFGVRDHHHSQGSAKRFQSRANCAPAVKYAKSTTGTRKGWHEMRTFKSTTYTKTNFEQIATAIGTMIKPVADLEAQFMRVSIYARYSSAALPIGYYGQSCITGWTWPNSRAGISADIPGSMSISRPSSRKSSITMI